MTVLEQRAYEAIASMAKKDELDYWTKLEHQYAGMAMQGLIIRDHNIDDIVSISDEIATALVEKMKEERI